MIKWLDEILVSARECFKRASTHSMFVVIVIGLMIGQEHTGVTSIIRELWLNPRHYYGVLHFFRSKAWSIESLLKWWIEVVKKSGVVYQENDMAVLVGDGTKKSKEGKKMPCVKRLHQESENSSKPAYIFGHMFGMIGVLAGNIGKLFCLPLSIKIHDGDEKIRQWEASFEETTDESHVVRIIRDASQAAKLLGKSILVLDAYYLSIPALIALSEEAKTAGRELLRVVVRAKKNATAFMLPVRKPGKGRPPKKGESVKLMDLFTSGKLPLTKATITMYGKEEKVSFGSCDLLWGKKHYQLLRFVVAQVAGSRPIILASTDLSLSPIQIIRLYSYRFKIECSFFHLKHTLAGFAYRFWSTAMPKLNRFATAGIEPLEGVADKNDKKLIAATFHAIQGYVMTTAIALGLLQICSLRFSDEINSSPLRWIRTRTNIIPSETSTADFMRKIVFKLFASNSTFTIIHFIQRLQPPAADSNDSTAA